MSRCAVACIGLRLGLRAGELLDQSDKLSAALLEVVEHVVACACRAKEDDVTGDSEAGGEADSFGK